MELIDLDLLWITVVHVVVVVGLCSTYASLKENIGYPAHSLETGSEPGAELPAACILSPSLMGLGLRLLLKWVLGM